MLRHLRGSYRPDGAVTEKLWIRVVMFRSFICIAAALFLSNIAAAQTVPSPRSVLGFQPTDDRTIADWKQITDYFSKLDAASDRVKVEVIGKTTLGKPQIVAYISSSKNIKDLDRIKAASQRISDPRRPLAKGGETRLFSDAKTIVAISCSIHSTEIVASQMSMLLAFELATAKDAATTEILKNTVLLLIPSANPDGIDIVADWYRKTVGTKFEGSSPPELYHHYAGHDNNRDWFMLNLEETRNITKLFWQDWFPQIVYDVHQQGQNGPRMTIPPFFDPPNPRIHPLIIRELGLIGYKIAADLQASGQGGIVTNSTYDTWWHGGFRSAPYFHNSIGILSEAASAELMSPITVSKQQMEMQRPTRGLKSPLETATNMPEAWQGGDWRPKDIARIEIAAARSVLEMAAKFRDRYLQNSRRLASENLIRKNADPEAFVVYAGQPNEETVARFLEILMWQGIEVHEMKRELEAAVTESDREKFAEIPAGSFLVIVNQPQKNNVLSLFERQEYPNRLNANGEAEVPYDVAGWTLPLQMGVDFSTVWEIKDLKDRSGTLSPVMNIDQARKRLNLKQAEKPFSVMDNPLKTRPSIGLYKSFVPSMDEGWTRLVLDSYGIPYKSLNDAQMRAGEFVVDSIILPSMGESSIVKGLSENRYPVEFTGGITDEGVENLKKFVTRGGRLICFDDSCEMVINKFGLPIKNAVKGVSRKDFYCPGSILRLEVDTDSTLAKGLNKSTAAYFTGSSAFELGDNSGIQSIATYAYEDLLLSGWILGEKYIAGKTAVAETSYGEGTIVLFAFRPQHRGQSFATFPFVFNALEKQ